MIPFLPEHPPAGFPPTSRALIEPNGLLAAGGDLSIDWLLGAYRRGIFPWFGEEDPILWWSPSPRCVLYLDRLHLSRRFRRTLRQHPLRWTTDQAFARVIDACAQPRHEVDGTWITPEMREAYLALHHAGHAHSLEVWDGNLLVGGVYGECACPA